MCTILFMTEGFLMYNIAFLTLEPKYMCINGAGIKTECQRLDTCKFVYNEDFTEKLKANPDQDFQNGFYIEPSSISLKNWMSDLNLRCVDKWFIGMFGTNFFVGQVTGAIMLSSYGDTIGRIFLIKFSQAVTLVSYIVIVFVTRDLMVIYMLLFLIGLLSSWRLSLGYIYGQEII
jgi:hypothetical protein